MPPQPKNPKAFKSQPWILFDSIVARSFLLGDTTNGKAIGSEVPAISANGEITFFQSSGRTRATMPWYTNLDMAGQLAYGLQVWQIYVNLVFPVLPSLQTRDPNGDADDTTVGVPANVRLMEAILNYGVLSLNLGQEDQAEWPLTRFGAGGGVALVSGGESGNMGATNALPQAQNVMKLPEPVEMGRTQNLSAKIRLAPEAFAMIGTLAAPGVGSTLLNYDYTLISDEVPTIASLPMLPFMIQLGLVGRRIKDTQYGQLVRDDGNS